MEIQKCPRCEGEMIAGQLSSRHGLSFQPHDKPFLFSIANGSPTQAQICPACGHLETRADVNRLRERLNR